MGWRGPVESIVNRIVPEEPAPAGGCATEGVTGELPSPPPQVARARLAQTAQYRASEVILEP